MNIKQENYQGYVWYSNDTKPIVYDGTKPINISFEDGQNPFIIEGLLWNNKTKESITIKNIDGKYYFKNKNIDELDRDEDMTFTEKRIVAHRIGMRWLLFRQYWRKKQDSECCGMNVYTPYALIFVGFENKEEQI